MQVDTGSFRALTSELETLRRERAGLTDSALPVMIGAVQDYEDSLTVDDRVGLWHVLWKDGVRYGEMDTAGRAEYHRKHAEMAGAWRRPGEQ